MSGRVTRGSTGRNPERTAPALIPIKKDGLASFALRVLKRESPSSGRRCLFVVGLVAMVTVVIGGFLKYGFGVSTLNHESRNRPRISNSALEKIVSRVCEQSIAGMAFSPDSQQVILSTLGECKVLGLRTGKRLLRIGVPARPAGDTLACFTGGVAVCSEGKIVLSHADETIRVFGKTGGEPEREFNPGPLGQNFPCLWYSDLGKCVVGCGPTQIRVWNVNSGEEWGRYDRHVIAMDMNRDGHDVVTIEDSHLIRVWNLWTGETRVGFRDESRKIDKVKFYRDGLLICWENGSAQFRLVNPYDPDNARTYCHAGNVNDVTAFPNHPLILSGGSDDILRLWAPETGSLYEQRCPDEVERIGISPDGGYAVVAMPNRVVLYRVDISRIRSKMKSHRDDRDARSGQNVTVMNKHTFDRDARAISASSFQFAGENPSRLTLAGGTPGSCNFGRGRTHRTRAAYPFAQGRHAACLAASQTIPGIRDRSIMAFHATLRGSLRIRDAFTPLCDDVSRILPTGIRARRNTNEGVLRWIASTARSVCERFGIMTRVGYG